MIFESAKKCLNPGENKLNIYVNGFCQNFLENYLLSY